MSVFSVVLTLITKTDLNNINQRNAIQLYAKFQGIPAQTGLLLILNLIYYLNYLLLLI